MAYNNGFPINYQYYQPVMQQPVPVMPVQQTPQMQATQIQNQAPQQPQYPIVQGGFVRVRSENEARMYPVAPGNSVTFIDEAQPYCYTKTVNTSQLDRPIFEKYRLVKEEDDVAPVDAPQRPVETPAVDLSKYAMKADIDAFKSEIDALKADIEAFRGDLYGLAGKKRITKKEVAADE